MDIVVLKETIDEIFERIPSLDKKKKNLGIKLLKTEIENLNPHLKKIQTAVNYHVQGQEVSQAWLRNLKTTVNDLNDLVEELSEDYATPPKSALPFMKTNHHKSQLKAVNSKIKNVIEGLKKVSEELFKIKTTTTTRPSQEAWKKTEETEFDPTILEKKEKIIDQLISFHTDPEPKVSVVTIAGFAGMGKTKLARLICEDVKIKDNFGLQIWIDDVGSLQKHVPDTSSSSTGRKGNLVVLDDLKTDEILGDQVLDDLDKLLMTSKGSSAILITTRSKLLANNITVRLRNITLVYTKTSPPPPSSASSSKCETEATPDTIFTTFEPHVFPELNEKESWSLFLKFRGQSSLTCDKEEMEREIVMECSGVRFLIIFTAIFLNDHGGKDAATFKGEFLQELKFRFYDKLPRLQKMCFAFCSLFPRDHLIDVERLIHLWTAEGFLPEFENSAVEEKLRWYFNDFVEIPIFKDIEEDECGGVRRCRMKPLMHDLARFVSDQKENVTVDPEGERVDEEVLQASFDFSLDVSREIPPSLFEKAKKLRAILLWKSRTLLPKEMNTSTTTCDKIFKTFKATLRMLDLHDMGIKTLPKSIGDMNNLRYLDLSHNTMEKLPDSITNLIHLQTLKLSQCYHLEELPKSIDELINLMHLEIDGCLALIQMPRKLHMLENSLQTLSLFVVSEGYILGGLSGLAKLNNLRGHLEISHLERSKLDLSKDDDDYLTGKNQLQALTLRWNHEDDYDEKEESADEDTLECLLPPSKLRAIFIVGYKGKTLSYWFPYMESLVTLSLYDCTSCIFLPHLDELPKLKFLELLRLDKLQYIADQKDGDSDNAKSQADAVYFPSLKELTISDCPNLKSWWKMNKPKKDLPFFACLSKLHVHYCPDLTCMPLFSGLDEELVLVGSSVQPLLESIGHGKIKCNPFSKLKSMQIANIEDSRSPPKIWFEYFNSLEKLDIKGWKHLKSLPVGFDNLSSLQSLNIENCQELDLSSSEWKGLKNLHSLTIREVPKLETLPLGVYKVTSLQDLQLHNCPNLTSLSETIDKLKSLRKLVISECDKLVSLPKALKNMGSHLDTLIILDCTLLLPRCQPDTGDDWPQIAHIKNKQIMETNPYI